jgi:hypothetical protein
VVRISILYPGEPAPDSLKLAKNFVLGKVSDDYGLSNYRLFIIRGISGNYQTGTIAIGSTTICILLSWISACGAGVL